MKIHTVFSLAAYLCVAGCFTEDNPVASKEKGFTLPESGVLLDDFEDVAGSADQITLTEMHKRQGGEVPQPPAGVWSVYHDDEYSHVLAPSGERIIDYLAIREGHASNFGLTVGDWGHSGRGVHMVWVLEGSNYPYVGFGTSFLGTFDEDWYDFSSLTAVSFWAKGSGRVRTCLTTDTIQNGYAEGQNWGHFSSDFTLQPQWTYYEFAAEDFVTKPYSPAQKDGLVWEDGMDKVCYFEIQNSQYYDRYADDTLEIYVDDIHLHGLTYEVFGLNKP
ncbi:MAG: hypothetical protein ACLFSB_14745 [Chitinispirillaceae bacterium]